MHSVDWLVLLQLAMWICKNLAIYHLHKRDIKINFLDNCVYVRNTFNYQNYAEIDLLKLCDLEPQGYIARDSNYFTCAYRW